MEAKTRRMIVIVIGIIVTLSGIGIALIPGLSTRYIYALVLMITGGIISENFARFTFKGNQYGHGPSIWIAKKLKLPMRSCVDLEGRKLLSTFLSLLGVLPFAYGLHLIFKPALDLSVLFGATLAMFGAFILFKFTGQFVSD